LQPALRPTPPTSQGRRRAGAPARPFLKWAGGKGQLLGQLDPLLPDFTQVKRYFEPFLGGGAVYFHVHPRLARGKAILGDSNADLVRTFVAVRDHLPELTAALTVHRQRHCEAYYYQVRATDPGTLPDEWDRAARFIYLNKTCFNGLHRVNSRGLFNVPFGRYANPAILDERALVDCNAALRGVDLRIGNFEVSTRGARKDDFVYFDPPYDPLTKTAAFTSYTSKLFGEDDQSRLAALFRKLDERGCLLMLSNSDTPLIQRLYRGFDIERVQARRNINSRPDARGPIGEVVVRNYG
jgi:DNA adenine methylase